MTLLLKQDEWFLSYAHFCSNLLWDKSQPRILIHPAFIFLFWRHPKWDISRGNMRMREAGGLWKRGCIFMCPPDGEGQQGVVTCGGALLS